MKMHRMIYMAYENYVQMGGILSILHEFYVVAIDKCVTDAFAIPVRRK